MGRYGHKRKKSAKRRSRRVRSRESFILRFLRLFSFFVVAIFLMIEFQNCGTSNNGGSLNLGQNTQNTSCTGCFPSTNPTPAPTAQLFALSNVIYLPQGAVCGATFVNWNAPSVSSVDLRVGSSSGPATTAGQPNTGFIVTAASISKTDGEIINPWVCNTAPAVFYLQPAGDTNPSDTLATLTIGTQPTNSAIVINPPVFSASMISQTTIAWNTTAANSIYIRVGSPTGAAFTNKGASGVMKIPSWVQNGTVFYLVNAANGNVLGSVTAQMQ